MYELQVKARRFDQSGGSGHEFKTRASVGFALASKGEKGIITFKIVSDSEVHIITNIDGHENQFDGKIVSMN